MTLWTLSIFAFFSGLGLLYQSLLQWVDRFRVRRHEDHLKHVQMKLQEVEELLVGGLLPDRHHWTGLYHLAPPWGELIHESIESLRSSGSPLLPTLKRLKSLVELQLHTLRIAKSKVSQAFAQAGVCGLLVPLVGIALYLILPSVQQRVLIWWVANFLALIWTGVGGIWLAALADQARWGGIRYNHRPWILCALCTGEKFLASVRAGAPPDVAWTQACQRLSQMDSQLGLQWGYSIWQAPQEKLIFNPMEKSLVSAGVSIRKAIHLSLMEGRPCTERVEGILQSLVSEIQAHLDRELNLLPTRALKPLFICVAPALLSLLCIGLWFVFTESMTEGFHGY